MVADGTITRNPRGSQYVELVSTDKELIQNFKRALGAGHAIGTKKPPLNMQRQQSYRIQIGNKHLIGRLIALGLLQKKKTACRFPRLPRHCQAHFIRGFFDGDGCVSYAAGVSDAKEGRGRYFQVIFTARDETFLGDLHLILKRHAGVTGGSLHKGTRCYRLLLSSRDGKKLFSYLYGDKEIVDKKLRLSRKHNVFVKAVKIFGGVV